VGAPGRVNLANKSGRGGTTGRAAGCPAKLGFAGGRSGPPLPMEAPADCPGAAGLGAGRGRAGMLGTIAPDTPPDRLPDAPPDALPWAPPCACTGLAGAGRPRPGWGLDADGDASAGAIGGRGCAGPLGPGAKPEVRLGGRGWRGPDRICPGLGPGSAGFTGIEAPRPICDPSGGTSGDPVDSGGRKGATRCAGAASSCPAVSRDGGAIVSSAGACGASG
jgi:hypothetical protein